MAKLAATSREPEEWQRATAAARETRDVVAGQVAELIVAGDQMGSAATVNVRLEAVREAARRQTMARTVLAKAREMSLPVGPAAEAVEEARMVLRAAVMELTVAGAAWVAAMDHEARRRDSPASTDERAVA